MTLIFFYKNLSKNNSFVKTICFIGFFVKNNFESDFFQVQTNFYPAEKGYIYWSSNQFLSETLQKSWAIFQPICIYLHCSDISRTTLDNAES